MLRRFLIAKIHQATVTATKLTYEGSVGIDEDLMDAVGLLAGEMVYVFNVNNGHRLETYTIPLARGSKDFTLNGAAARLGQVGDRLIILAYGLAEEPPAPRKLDLDENNDVVSPRG
ncbi:MAG: aspartate 1-decarboxylase [bacterium]